MKWAIYARESDDDTTKAPPIEKQIEIGKRSILELDNEAEIMIVYDRDNGFSGGDWNRPDWNQSKNDVKRHLYQRLWVWCQDRIARDTEQFLNYYRVLDESKAKIYSETEGWIDMSTLGGRVKHTTLAQAAEIFRIVTSDKVKHAYKRKKEKEGKCMKWGRPKINIDEERVISLHKVGYGYRKIGEKLGVSYQTIKRIIDKCGPITK
jgi:site-specific DNA recombinase